MNVDLKNRQHVLALLAAAAVALLVGQRLIYDPLLASWRERSGQIRDLRLRVERGEGTLGRERSIRATWDRMRTNALPDAVSAAEGRVLGAFDQWSEVSRISINSIKPQWKHPADEYMTLECRVDATGGLGALTRFLYEVEHDPLALKVELVELSTRENDGSLLTLGLQVSGLFLNPKQP